MESVDAMTFPSALSIEPGLFAAREPGMSAPGFVFSAWSGSDGGRVSSGAAASGGFEESWYSSGMEVYGVRAVVSSTWNGTRLLSPFLFLWLIHHGFFIGLPVYDFGEEGWILYEPILHKRICAVFFFQRNAD